MIYLNSPPNPAKIAPSLEETGLTYDRRPVDATLGQQYLEGFIQISPNARVPSILHSVL
jgi:glutathione S-transferase